MAKILVTGGAGFIGSYIVEEIVARGHAVRVLDSLVEQVHGLAADRPAFLHPATELIRGDVRDAVILRRALDGVEAAEVGVGQSMAIGRTYHAPRRGVAVFQCLWATPGIANPYTGVAAIFSSRLGFEPLVRFEDGLGDLVSWVKTQSAVDHVEQARSDLQAHGLIRA
jgi:nucleoside-diphosphate-sugar epimerase